VNNDVLNIGVAGHQAAFDAVGDSVSVKNARLRIDLPRVAFEGLAVNGIASGKNFARQELFGSNHQDQNGTVRFSFLLP